MYIIGAVIGEKNVKAALFGEDHKIIATGEKSFCCAPKAADALAELSKAIISDNNIKAEDVAFIGAALPFDMGSACEFAKSVEEKTGIVSVADELFGAKAKGEAFLSGDVSSLALISVGDRVESGLVIDKKIFTGIDGLGAKLGHIVIDTDGYKCACGRKGCFEAFASNGGAKKIAADFGIGDAENMTVEKLFSMNDDKAEAAKEFYVKYIACAITDVINLFQPNVLVLDGVFSKVGDALMIPMMKIVDCDQYASSLPEKTIVRFATADVDTALLGAALIAK